MQSLQVQEKKGGDSEVEYKKQLEENKLALVGEQLVSSFRSRWNGRCHTSPSSDALTRVSLRSLKRMVSGSRRPPTLLVINVWAVLLVPRVPGMRCMRGKAPIIRHR